jgi:hypothetical protein
VVFVTVTLGIAKVTLGSAASAAISVPAAIPVTIAQASANVMTMRPNFLIWFLLDVLILITRRKKQQKESLAESLLYHIIS